MCTEHVSSQTNMTLCRDQAWIWVLFTPSILTPADVVLHAMLKRITLWDLKPADQRPFIKSLKAADSVQHAVL
ncbi:hypothetical protein VTL71DRAFT_10010 [Oculimacula yallundae]|uniref:Uncharacterized protein n=1 Tax=Oculimacula yallundae TaxID=86028 RepID=A0ABR4BQ40_9HELO